VVKPTPKNADRAWNRADSRESPVSDSATVATRVTTSESRTTAKTEASAATLGCYPQTECQRCSS
jgi:hypothetical protein